MGKTALGIGRHWVGAAAIVVLALFACKRSEESSGSGTSTAAPAAAWKVGDKVDVEWNGDWWDGEIIGIQGGLYRVHYIGWESSWDENVTAARLRKPTGTARRK